MTMFVYKRMTIFVYLNRIELSVKSRNRDIYNDQEKINKKNLLKQDNNINEQ